MNLHATMIVMGDRAKAATRVLALASTETKNKALTAAARAIRTESATILAENAKDMKSARVKNLSAAMLDRLELTPARIEGMAKGLDEIAALPDPVGTVITEWNRPNGLHIARVRVPLGVIGIIYESRPNVTADAGGLCLKSGNAAILRGGSESFHSSSAIMRCLQTGLREAGLPETCIQSVPTTDREAVGEMLTMTSFIDVIVPRGGRSLVERVVRESRIPLFQHLEGLCHTYVDKAADPEMARRIVMNAKMRRTGICGATETLLVDRAIPHDILRTLVHDLLEAGCEVRGDETVQEIDSRVIPATEDDWTTEYLDSIISVKMVDGVEGAIDHIERYGSHHTDAIVTNTPETAAKFLSQVDSATVLHNASTQFADGGEFGMGAEIGIATGKLHARGPVGVEQLTSFKYVVHGSGQIRPV